MKSPWFPFVFFISVMHLITTIAWWWNSHLKKSKIFTCTVSCYMVTIVPIFILRIALCHNTVIAWLAPYLADYGPLARYVKFRFAHAPWMPGMFPLHRGFALPTCMHDARAVMHRWRGKVLGIPGACATRSFTHLVRGPWLLVHWNRHGHVQTNGIDLYDLMNIGIASHLRTRPYQLYTPGRLTLLTTLFTKDYLKSRQ